MATETVETETQSTEALTDTTGAIYHNGNEKPTERWCFECVRVLQMDKGLCHADEF